MPLRSQASGISHGRASFTVSDDDAKSPLIGVRSTQCVPSKHAYYGGVSCRPDPMFLARLRYSYARKCTARAPAGTAGGLPVRARVRRGPRRRRRRQGTALPPIGSHASRNDFGPGPLVEPQNAGGCNALAALPPSRQLARCGSNVFTLAG
jgi:hypothetical protein